jgi:hypothetical protein
MTGRRISRGGFWHRGKWGIRTCRRKGRVQDYCFACFLLGTQFLRSTMLTRKDGDSYSWT